MDAKTLCSPIFLCIIWCYGNLDHLAHEFIVCTEGKFERVGVTGCNNDCGSLHLHPEFQQCDMPDMDR
jgi:hypothetical protein